jgi:hypothetical protein
MSILLIAPAFAANPFLVFAARNGVMKASNNEEATKKIAAMDKPPAFEENSIYGISTGHFKHQEVDWTTTISLKDDLCVYDSIHPSGHFKRIVWKKGVGLIQYDSGYGAMKDGFRLKRVNTTGKS